LYLIIFGPGKLPELAEGLGKGIKSFKNTLKEGQDTPLIEQPKEDKKA